MELQDDTTEYQGRYSDVVGLKPAEYVEKKNLRKYKVACAVSRCPSSGLLFLTVRRSAARVGGALYWCDHSGQLIGASAFTAGVRWLLWQISKGVQVLSE